MASARNLKKRQANRLIRSQLVFAVAADPLDASGEIVLTLWSGRRVISRSLSPEWAASLAQLLTPDGQSPSVAVDPSAPVDGKCGPVVGLNTGFAQEAKRSVFGHAQDALLASIETRLTQEMLRLVGPLREFARRSQLIREEIPNEAQFCKLISAALPILSLHFANALLESAQKNTFAGDGVLYLKDIGLGLNDLVREVDLEGRKFLAVALVERKSSDIFKEGVASLKGCNSCGGFHL
jgi:hypothetical protein